MFFVSASKLQLPYVTVIILSSVPIIIALIIVLFYIKYRKFVDYVRFYSKYIEISNRGFSRIIKPCEFSACVCSKYDRYEETHYLKLSFYGEEITLYDLITGDLLRLQEIFLKYYGKELSECY
ncbi:MAG: hypothetical protein RXQ22_07660 [Sulfolobus sp.]